MDEAFEVMVSVGMAAVNVPVVLDCYVTANLLSQDVHTADCGLAAKLGVAFQWFVDSIDKLMDTFFPTFAAS